MPDTGNAKDYLKLPPNTFLIFTLKNVTWRTYLISFTVQYCFLFRFVCIELVSLIWFLQIWVAIYVYGIMINWSTLIKKLMQTYIVKISGSILNLSTVHLNGIWHLIWRYLSKPVLGGHPVLRWLDWIFWSWYLPSLSINYVGMNKDMGKKLPQLYHIKMKISYDLGFIAIRVAIAT